jgi:hypothetical protein
MGLSFGEGYRLSKATTDKIPASSRYLPPLISKPFFVAVPITDTMETGVDITSAQGHLINSIAIHKIN